MDSQICEHLMDFAVSTYFHSQNKEADYKGADNEIRHELIFFSLLIYQSFTKMILSHPIN